MGRDRLRATTVGLVALGAVTALGLAGTIPAAARPAQAEPLAGLSTRQVAGQRVIYSYPGLEPPPELLDIIRKGEAAGVIFFGENITDAEQIKGVIEQFQRANEDSPVRAPLLMMTDQEGGQIRRLPGEPKQSEKQIGDARNDTVLARAAGVGAGRNLKRAGLNVNLAPVLGVYREPHDFLDQWGRSYSKSPKVVAELAPLFITAQQRTGVAATAKHFPGLGAAGQNEDTDAGPVTLDLSKKTLQDVDEYPYPDAIKAGVELVMVSWAIYPAYDAQPAGLSKTIVQGQLRDRLGFEGVTITDALEAGALTPLGSIPENGVKAAEAGMDLLLYSAKDVSEGVGGLDALSDALESGRLDRSAFDAAAKRVIALREKIGERLR